MTVSTFESRLAAFLAEAKRILASFKLAGFIFQLATIIFLDIAYIILQNRRISKFLMSAVQDEKTFSKIRLYRDSKYTLISINFLLPTGDSFFGIGDDEIFEV